MSHIPERTCIACRLKGPKKQFFKIVRNKKQQVFFDEFGKLDGRSIYLCKKFKCIDRALHTKKGDLIQYHLKVKLTNEEKEEIFQQLEALLDVEIPK